MAMILTHDDAQEREYYDPATIAQEEQRAQAKNTLEANTQPAPKIDL